MQGYRSEATDDGPENELSGPVGWYAEVRATKLRNDGCGDCDDMPVQVQNRPAAAATSSLSIVDDRRRDDLSHDTSTRQWPNELRTRQSPRYIPETERPLLLQIGEEILAGLREHGAHTGRISHHNHFVSGLG